MRLYKIVLVALVGLLASVNSAMAMETCVIDQMMRDNRLAMNDIAREIFDQNVSTPTRNAIMRAPDIKDATCLAVLDQMDSLIRMRIPSMTGMMGGLMTKIADFACKAANSFLQDYINNLGVGWSDPFGLGGISIGGNTNGTGGIQVERYDIGRVVEGAVETAVRGNAGALMNKLPSAPNNRAPDRSRQLDNVIREEINGAIRGL